MPAFSFLCFLFKIGGRTVSETWAQKLAREVFRACGLKQSGGLNRYFFG